MQSVARRGLRSRAGEFESGDDHDGSRNGGPHIHRAADQGIRRSDHQARTAGCAVADCRRSDGAEHCGGTCRQRHSRRIQRRDDRRESSGREDGRRPAAVQTGDGTRSASRRREAKSSAISAKRSAMVQELGFPDCHPSVIHARRHRRRHRVQQRRIRRDRSARSGPESRCTRF